MPVPDPPADNLTDDDLQSEIELVGDLVVAATGSDGPLPQSEIDRLLGVAHGGAAAPDPAPSPPSHAPSPPSHAPSPSDPTSGRSEAHNGNQV